MKEFKNLFQPLMLQNLTLKNRLIMAPMASRFATLGGYVTRRMLCYYEARAKGGVGLVMVEATAVSEDGRAWPHCLCIYNDKFITGLSELAQIIHSGGAKAGIEIFHAGRRALSNVISQQPVAPTSLPCYKGEIPRELTRGEIEILIENFAQSALRAKLAGFDVINIHAAHGYLIHQFLSPLSNKRTDEFGGDIEGRCRFLVCIIERIRELVGDKFPIFCRLSADEFVAGGLTINESSQIACILEQSGVTVVDVSAGGPEAPHKSTQPISESPGCLVHLAEGIKNVIGIPVSVAGKINNPVLAEEILSQQKADLICIGRALIADPNLPLKALGGNLDEIIPCIGCGQGCSERGALGVGISCTVNPQTGREGMFDPVPVLNSKKVIVVGGGVAGMVTAVTAARKGHKVILFEKTERLGGQALLASKPPFKREIQSFVTYLEKQLGNHGIEVHLRQECDGMQQNLPADIIVFAIGARPIFPIFPGAGSNSVISALQVLREEQLEGSNIAIIGGGQVGCETAEYLLQQGKQVTIFETQEDVGLDFSRNERALLFTRLHKKNIEILTRATVTRIEAGTIYVSQAGLELKFEGFDSIVLATGFKPNQACWDGADHDKIRFAGDCVKPGRLFEAVHSGFLIANNI